jgi:glycosyltransferase involved in cell wall biosynthesis
VQARAVMRELPLRILQVAGTPFGGDWFCHQVSGLARLGHQVSAVVPADGPLADKLRSADIPVYLIPMGLTRRLHRLPGMAAAKWQLLRLIRELRPDVIHAHLVMAAVSCRIASLGYRRALRVTQVPGTVHLRDPLLRQLEQWTLSRDDLVIGSCEAIADEYRVMGAREIAVGYYGCDVHRLDPGQSSAALRAEFGLAADTPTIGLVGYMYPSRLPTFPDYGIKGHEVFIDAAPPILERVPGAHLFVVGDELSGTGRYRHELEARATALGLSGRMHFTGWRSDIPSVLAGLDVAVNPSIGESACYTMVEALLMGKGVVASNVGGLPDTVRDGETGLLVPPGDPAALARAVTELVADPARRADMGNKGRDHCLQRFDITATVAQLDELYRHGISALPERRRGA